MSVLNQTVVESTTKQLKRIRIAYIFAIVTMSLLLLPGLNVLLGRMLFISVTVGLLIFIKRELKKHYRDNLMTIALSLIGFSFFINIIQDKVYTLANELSITTDPVFAAAILIGLLIYALVLTAFILTIISASRFFEQVRQFNMMVRYQNITSYGPTPFKLNAVSIEPSTVYEKRNHTNGQLISFIVRAICVITLYFLIMNVDSVTYVVLTPVIAILQAARPSMSLNDQQFIMLAQIWFNFYLQLLFVTTFVLLFRKEIRLGLKRLFKPQKFAFVFAGYGIEFILILIVALILNFFNIHSQQSKNQEFIEQMQKILPFISAIGTIFLAPITEELVFRQGLAELLYRICDSFTKTPKKIVQDIAIVTAVLISGILFGFIHVMNNGDYIAMVPYVVSGLVYTTIYFWSGRNVTVTICIHVLHNAIATFMTM